MPFVLKAKLNESIRRSRYSPEQICRRIGVEPTTLAQWVTGTRRVPVEYVDLLAHSLETTREFLMGMVDLPMHWKVAEERVADLTRADLFGAVDEATRIVMQEKKQRPVSRSYVTFGADGLPMLPPNRPATRCSCGRVVNP